MSDGTARASLSDGTTATGAHSWAAQANAAVEGPSRDIRASENGKSSDETIEDRLIRLKHRNT